MARRRRTDDQQGLPALVVMVVVVGGPLWLWHHLGPWRLPALLAAIGVLALALWLSVRRAYRRRAHQQLLDEQYALTQTMTGGQFEELTVRLLARAGWPSVHRVGGSGDLGADVLADHAGTRLVVQCKRWSTKKVGSRDMQTFLGTVFHVHRADLAVYVTTSTYTAAAATLAASANVHLLDGPALAHWQAYGPPSWLDRRPAAPGRVAATTSRRPR